MMFTANAALRRRPDERDPERGPGRLGKRGRHHADNGPGLPIELDGPPDDRHVAAELHLPERVREHDDVRAITLIVARRDAASDERLYAEDGEERWLDPRGAQHPRLRSAG